MIIIVELSNSVYRQLYSNLSLPLREFMSHQVQVYVECRPTYLIN